MEEEGKTVVILAINLIPQLIVSLEEKHLTKEESKYVVDYLQNIIGMDHDVVSYYFSVTSLTAPIGGVIVGGCVMSAYGGYNNRTS